MLRQRQCRNVLICRGVEVVQHSGHIHDSSNVRTVSSSPGHPGGTDRPNQIRTRAGSQNRNHRLAVPVIEHKLIGVSHEARGLFLCRFVEAFLVKLNHQASRQDEGTFVKGLRI